MAFLIPTIHAIVLNDSVRVGLVKPHQVEDEIPHFYSEGSRPNRIAGCRDATSASLELGNEGVIFDADLCGEVTLGAPPFFPKLFQPTPSTASQFCGVFLKLQHDRFHRLGAGSTALALFLGANRFVMATSQDLNEKAIREST